MAIQKLLIANRGEIAVRIARAARSMGIRTCAIFADDDNESLHTRRADEAYSLPGSGAAAYLDIAEVVALANRAGCDGIHPGYGFLAENPSFAAAVTEAGLNFVGPTDEMLSQLGDKTRARAIAAACDVPVVAGTDGPTSLDEAREFFERVSRGAGILLKAVAGGGGRGMRVVPTIDELPKAMERASSEARAAFDCQDLYVEQYMPRVRHVEVQIIGDGNGPVVHLYERECTLQRRHQKLIEVAPSPKLPKSLRDEILAAAVKMAAMLKYRSLGTFEFLVDEDDGFFFIEANPRLQVEHTVTEEVTGVDLVRAQLAIAGGATLAELGLEQQHIAPPRGFAVQTRINMENWTSDGKLQPSSGLLNGFDVPSGPGIRVDTFGYVGYRTNPRYDSLLAKLIAHSPEDRYEAALSRAYNALCEFKITGVTTNLDVLQNLLLDPEVQANEVYTRFVDDRLTDLANGNPHQQLYFPSGAAPQLAGARVDEVDPLAVLAHGTIDQGADAPSAVTASSADGYVEVRSPLQGTVLSLAVTVGAEVHEGQELIVMDAMKMEHVVDAPASGVVRRIDISVGDTVYEDHPLLAIEERAVDLAQHAVADDIDLDHIRDDLAEVIDRHEQGFDHRRQADVAKRHARGHRTARQNLADIVDEGTFIEYGPLVIAAQRRRRSLEDLIARTPGDGMICGIGTVNGDHFPESRARTMFMSYDYMVLAGTQGKQNHQKKDRMFEIAREWQLPLVLLAEGGGGRPGDTDSVGVAGLHCLAFNYLARLSGLVPLVGVTNGRCFAGNAVLLSMCDVIIATEGSNIGIGGPAMIEGGGLGVFKPEEVGPMDVQVPNGVVDILVKDEAAACQVAKKYLSYFQGPLDDWECADQRLLRNCVPENRLRVYDVRRIIEIMADTGSVLELRRNWGPGMITALIRIEGRPLGVMANNPTHLSGAIDTDAADKGARFIQLCDAFDIPLVSLCDCPGIMVGPEIEREALVRHAGRMFLNSANITVPFFTIILRKAYGLGAQAMAGGSFHAPLFTVSWPTGEFGGMGLEGAVKLGFRKELAAIEDPQARKQRYEEMVAKMYENGKAVNAASHFEIDDVIDPEQSRAWIIRALRAVPSPDSRRDKKRPCVDAW